MRVEVRPASEGDFEALLRLNDAVQAVHVELYPDDFKKVVDRSAARDFFATRLASIAIAELDGAPSGYVWYEFLTRPDTLFSLARPCIYVHHLSVAPSARRRGVGAALMRYVEQRAAAESLSEIALDVWAANHAALRFFGAQGYVNIRATLLKKLGRPN
jgi:GNAT superfamily N-acetyltransferase